jgi:long-chain acyl-CoA synthetase
MDTLPAMISEALDAHARPDLIVERVGERWSPTSTARLRERIRRVALGLRSVGLNAKDPIALLASNSVDWIVADLGILFAGCVVVPIFSTQALDQIGYILAHSESRALFVESAVRAHALRERLGLGIPIFAFDDPEGLAALEERGARIEASQPELSGTFAASATPGDLAVLMYTSGTTGEPKGVMLSHRNLVTTTRHAFAYAFPALSGGECTLTILPFAHIYEHIVLYGKLTRAVSLHICRDGANLLRDLHEVRPVLMTAVPRIFEHVLAGILMKARSEGGIRARVVPWALAAGREYMRVVTGGGSPSLAQRLQYAVARRLVLNKFRALLGLSELRFFVSGSASLHVDLSLTFAAADITIVEGYGTTECSPVITVNRLADNRLGTVGKPIPKVEVRLDPDGEVLVRGPGVMLGYYKDEAANAAVFEGDWYRTGDIGTLDADGYLRIVDRKKELFKTTSGKFIAPSRIESALMRSPYISQAVVLAEGRAAPAALISPKWEYVDAPRDQVRALIRREVAQYTKDLAPYERVHHVALLPRDLTIEDGELSPTLKIRRRIVEERYAGLLEAEPAPA